MARVLVTRPAGQNESLVRALTEVGLEPVVVPAIAIEIDPPGGVLDSAARVLHTFDWVVITSPNGARAILAAAERVPAALETPRWAAIGTATAAVLEREGIETEFQPSRADVSTLARELPVRNGDEIVLLRGDLASRDPAVQLRERGAVVTDVVVYRTVEGPAGSRLLLRQALLVGRPSLVVFASGSAVRGLVDLAGHERSEVTTIPAACIGPETAHEAARLGFDVIAVAPNPDPSTLAATAIAALAQPLETRR